MKELSSDEEHWLVVFGRYNPFFEDLSRYYLKNNCLSEKQYESLEKEIEIAEEDGKCILDIIDFRFLKEHAEENKILREILENYEEDGFLDDSDFNKFIDIKLELNPDLKKREILTSKSENESQRKKKYDDTPNNFNAKEINLEKITEFLNKEFLAKDHISNHLTYGLKLENNKWWIGKTRLILKTIEDFKRGKGNNWVLANHIVSIEKLDFNTDTASLTLEYMKKYGWENVQGSSWYDNQLEMYIPIKILNYVNKQKKLKSKNDMKVRQFDDMEDVITKDLEESTYVLKLENDKWYVGSTFDLESDLKKHELGKKSSWTKLYKVEKVEEKDLSESLRDVSIRYMNKYKWWNVRGFPFRGKGEKWPPEEITVQFNSVNKEDSEKAVVYILRLENAKWYIGRTYNMARSLKFHKLGSPP